MAMRPGLFDWFKTPISFFTKPRRAGILPADKLTVDGVHLKGGVYGAVDSGAEHEVAWISGDGLLKVASRATVLIFK